MLNPRQLLAKYYTLVPWKELIDTVLGSEYELPYNNLISWDQNGIGEEVIQHRMYLPTICALESFMTTCSPLSLHLGARYAETVINKDSSPLYRSNFVLDYDIDSSKASCGCSEKMVCPICWKEVAIPCAQAIIRYLRKIGFYKVFAVFSGRRGIHFWIVDKHVRMLPTEERMFIVECIEKECNVSLDKAASNIVHAIKLPYSIHPSTKQASLPFNPFSDTWRDIYPQFNIDVLQTTASVNKDFMRVHFPIEFVKHE